MMNDNIFNSINSDLFEESVSELYTEAVYPENIEYMRLYRKKMFLPKGTPSGKNNIAFLYTNSYNESISLMDNKVNLLNNNKYKYYFTNNIYRGKIFNKRFNINIYSERKSLYKKITDETNITPIINYKIHVKSGRSFFYDLSYYLNIFNNYSKNVNLSKKIMLYWDYIKKITTLDNTDGYNKFIIINLNNFSLSNKLKENISNPLFMIYYTLYRNEGLLKDMNIDFIFFISNKVLKINPSLLNKKDNTKIKSLMNMMMKDVVHTSVIDNATDEKVIEKEETKENIKEEIIRPISKDTTPANNPNRLGVVLKTSDENEEDDVDKEIEDKIDKKIDEVLSKNTNTDSDVEVIDDLDDPEILNKDDEEEPNDTEDDTSDSIASVKREIEKDHELLTKIYYQNKAKDLSNAKSQASTARDNLLRKEQEKIKVNKLTIKDLELLDSDKINIPINDISNEVRTTNEGVKHIRFKNLDTTYNRELIKKDIISAFTSLSDKSIPMFIRDMKIEDTSDELNYKDTYTLHYEDGNRKRHTVKVDIPKFIDDRFLYIGGNKKVIKHQSFFLPVVKIAPNKVEIVTNYSKMTIERDDNLFTDVTILNKIVATHPEIKEYFTIGDVFVNNKEFVTTLEYDDLSKSYSKFSLGRTLIFFDQNDAMKYAEDNKITIPKNNIFIGKFKGENIFIGYDKQVDKNDNTIVDLIIKALPEEISEEYKSSGVYKRAKTVKVKIMSQNMAVGMLLGFWEGLTNLLKKMNVKYDIINKKDYKGIDSSKYTYIAFNDCYLIYEKHNIPASLILNGFYSIDTKKYDIADMDTREPYIEYIAKVYGKIIIENALMNFYEFVIDPITKDVLSKLNLPENIVELYIYAVKLLGDSQYNLNTDLNLCRIRCGEIIPAILYERISKNYITFRNSNGEKKYTIPQNCVIQELLAQKTVEDYSTLNPMLEMNQLHAVSNKGFRGVNLDESYTIERRGYHDSMIGTMAPATSPDGSVGVSRVLSLEPNITNLRGFIRDAKKNNELGKLTGANVFSPVELSTPLATTYDDPNRLGHNMKQSCQLIPVRDASPVLISNGMDEALRFHTTSNFTINADEDGTIVDYDPKANIVMAKYKSGKVRAIDLNDNIVKNGGGGFFLSNKLVTDLKVGDKFKKNDILAYHKDFFTNDNFNSCRFNSGVLCKVAIMSLYNTYEDATVITNKLSERCSTEMCFLKSAVIGKNSNVFYMVKKGQEITVGDPLVQFDTSYDDESINALLKSLGDDDRANILEESRNVIKSKYSGIIEDIKIYSTVDLDDLSPSLKTIVSSYYSEINRKKRFLEKYDNSGDIVKAGILFNETTKKIDANQFGNVKGNKVGEGVLVEFYIKHNEPLEVGSKLVNFTALKNTVSEIIPEGYEPYSEFRPDEEVSTFIAANSILNRMTPSILLTAFGNKCIIELKRKLKEMNFDRKKMEDLIYKVFTALDPKGINTTKYKSLFNNMTDIQFKKYFTDLFSNEKAYLVLDINEYENSLTMDNIENAAKVLGIPLYENVVVPHLTLDKEHATVTKVPVPVGYINIKRTQQTIMKKNGLSTDITERSSIFNQVTGKDKNGRESDLENIMLLSWGAEKTLKELNGPRADDPVMKQQMLRDIALNGYTKLSDMEDNIENKTTLNVVDVYFKGMSIDTDLVTKGLMVNSTLREEL